MPAVSLACYAMLRGGTLTVTPGGNLERNPR